MLRSFAFLTVLFATTSITSSAEFEGARSVPFHGYSQAIELSNGPVKVVLAPESGGRVLEYSLNGKNSLYLSDDEKAWKPGEPAKSSAGRFDIGPELVIPERKVLWSGDWKGEIVGARHARLTSPDDASTGTRLVRDFVLDVRSSKLLCTQTIHNISTRTTEWCHWSRTFAVGQGICLIPLSSPSRFPNHYVMYEEGALINMRPVDPKIRVREDFLEILGTPRKPKLGFDSYSGIIAYVSPSDLLFVKKFETYPDRVYNEAAGLTVSVWYPNGPMIELEPIGPRERLAPGESASFTEEWWLSEMKFPKDSDLDLKAIRTTLESLK